MFPRQVSALTISYFNQFNFSSENTFASKWCQLWQFYSSQKRTKCNWSSNDWRVLEQGDILVILMLYKGSEYVTSSLEPAKWPMTITKTNGKGRKMYDYTFSISKGSCDQVGRAVASYNWQTRFDSNHEQIYLDQYLQFKRWTITTIIEWHFSDRRKGI